MVTVNGKEYPFWSQFVEGKEKWIGGILEDLDGGSHTTVITDIELVPNGKVNAFFRVCGKDFSCGFCTSAGGVGPGDKEWITFSGYAGHIWRIKSKGK